MLQQLHLHYEYNKIDVKPENILLHMNGRVKLSDFGVAKILPDIERCCSTSGTHGYMVLFILFIHYSTSENRFSL